MEYKRPLFVIALKAIALNSSNQVLLIQRSIDDHTRPLGWDLPGGGIDENEQPVEGIKREIKEETGLDVSALEIIDAISIPNLDNTTAIMIAFKTKTDSENVILSKEHDDYKWMSKEEVKNTELPETYKKFIEKVFLSLRSF